MGTSQAVLSSGSRALQLSLLRALTAQTLLPLLGLVSMLPYLTRLLGVVDVTGAEYTTSAVRIAHGTIVLNLLCSKVSKLSQRRKSLFR